MIKPLLLVAIIAGIAAFGGYQFGTKSPTMGDCVNSIIGGK
jgi:parvulin-like peptidyl-prolyl isomerase